VRKEADKMYKRKAGIGIVGKRSRKNNEIPGS
jgi:hypothetical protein